MAKERSEKSRDLVELGGDQDDSEPGTGQVYVQDGKYRDPTVLVPPLSSGPRAEPRPSRVKHAGLS